MLEVGI